GTTVTTTSCAWGRTSRNQPTQPASASTTPRTLTDTAVSKPANMSVTPAARTSGHAVGAGISISKALRSDDGTGCMATAVSSAPDHVDDREDDDPDPVDEVPVQSEHIDAGRVLPSDVAGDREQRDDRHQDQADDDVERVQADQRVVRGPEQVRGNREPVLVDQPVPFPPRAEQKRSPERDRRKPQRDERPARAALQRRAGKLDRETAGKQARREQDRRLQHLARRRPAEALAHVVEVGDDEDREDRRLPDDEARHAHRAARWEPFCVRVGAWNRDGAHESLLTRTGCPGPPDASGPTADGGWRRSGSSRSCRRAAASWSTTRASTHPRDRCPPERPC